MKANWIFLFWGALDLLYVGRFSYVSYSQGKIPIYTDVQSFIQLAAEHGGLSGLIFALYLLLNMSMLISAVLLLCRHRVAPCLVYIQTPLRLLLAVPSLSFIPLLVQGMEVRSVDLIAGLVIFSEVIKVSSVLFRGKLERWRIIFNK
ncbi:hypothetical protein [Pseudomonas huanghezhanensis]|uniref:hypothetical protein n=1 Tax=Pseudomonas huanghezhanensis TaxID=3002903 RepID=UPI002285D240|nr:hypothetical protein [Pseudomonas sp. BSw22131]